MKNTVKALELIILIVVVIGFLVIFTSAVSTAWRTHWSTAEVKKLKEIPETQLYIATSVSAFMTAFFANKLGVKVPDGESIHGRNLLGKLKGLVENFENTKIAIGALYLIVYFVVALIAIITWATIPDLTPAVIKNVASISVTLFLGVAKSVLDTIPG